MIMIYDEIFADQLFYNKDPQPWDSFGVEKFCEKFVEEVPLIMAAADMNLEDLKQATLSKVKVLGEKTSLS